MMRTFRRVLAISLLSMLIVFAAFAADESKRITAYKQVMKDYLPKKSVSVRCLTAVGEDIAEDQQMILSEGYRGNNLPGFTWICSGNVFGQVTVTFTFGPLKHVDTSKTTNNFIYYSVVMQHTESRIGNASVTIGKAPSNDGSLKRVFPTDNPEYEGKLYALIYSDKVTVPGSFDVKTASVSKDIVYDLSTYSLVFRRRESGDTSETAANFKTALSPTDTDYQNTCEYWNRYGSVSLLLDVKESDQGGTTVYKTNSNKTQCDTGWYCADVTIAISAT